MCDDDLVIFKWAIGVIGAVAGLAILMGCMSAYLEHYREMQKIQLAAQGLEAIKASEVLERVGKICGE